MWESRLERIGNKLIMSVDAAEHAEAYSIANPVCFENVARLVLKNNPDEIMLVGEFKKLYSVEQTQLIKEAAEAIQKAERETPPILHGACAKCYGKRQDKLDHIRKSLWSDPVHAYFEALDESYAEPKHGCEKCAQAMQTALQPVKALESTELVRAAKREGDAAQAFAKLFSPWTIPSFITSFIDPSVPKGAKALKTKSIGTATVTIYELPGRAEKLYHVTAPEFLIHEEENKLINGIFEDITRQEARVVNPTEARECFKDLAKQKLHESSERFTEKRVEELADVIARYSAGYGVLEIFLLDDSLEDVYVDSPGRNPVYAYHSQYEECVSNITLSEFDLEKLSARFRAISGRPFDESMPVLHAELPEMGVRVCGLCPPATFGGIGYAFRRRRSKPWTLPQFVKARMMDARTAGLLSTLVDSQSSILVTGPRGSGKSSLLSALLTEASPLFRFIVIEDTPELPIDNLQSIGYKIQHIKTRPSFSGGGEGSYELSSEDALRTALRLGESVLVLGEVRGPEAKALFEAMRVGAAGNVVLGTIHGSSAYDTWDRIVNDLGIPSTSFKATDIVVSVAAVRAKDGTKRTRKLTSVTEVKKHWQHDPYLEKGFSELVEYDAAKDKWRVSKALAKSETFKRVAGMRGVKPQDLVHDSEFKAKLFSMLVERSEGAPWLLEVESVARFDNAVRQAKPNGEKKALEAAEKWITERRAAHVR